MQREGKAPMIDNPPPLSMKEDYARCLSMLGALRLGTPIGNPPSLNTKEASFSTSHVDASSYPASWRFDAHQPQPQRYQNPRLPLPYTTIGNNRGLLPFTTPPPPPSPSPSPSTSIFSPANYRPCNGHMNVPQAPYPLQLQASRMHAQESIFDTIAAPEMSNRLTHKVEEVKGTGSMSQIEQIILLMSDPPSLLRYACDKNGSLALQKLIKTVQSSCLAMYELTGALARGFPQVACDASGRHVIKECFKELSFAQNAILSTKMVEHCVTLATNEYGCICLNDCIPLMESTFKDRVLASIVINCSYLAQNYYGTYVVQNAITRKHPVFTLQIVQRLRSDILSLATQKQGSHLVEKCFGLSSTKKIVMEELLRLSSHDMLELACHEFGNFVLQSALSSTWDEESPDVQNLARRLRQVLSLILGDLKLHPIGKNVYKKCRQTVGHRRVLSTSSGMFNVHNHPNDC